MVESSLLRTASMAESVRARIQSVCYWWVRNTPTPRFRGSSFFARRNGGIRPPGGKSMYKIVLAPLSQRCRDSLATRQSMPRKQRIYCSIWLNVAEYDLNFYAQSTISKMCLSFTLLSHPYVFVMHELAYPT